jgi:hypothetical protein
MDPPHGTAESPALIGTIDLTEELDNDVASELPNPGMSINVAPRRAIDAEADVAKCEANGNPPIVTSSTGRPDTATSTSHPRKTSASGSVRITLTITMIPCRTAV